MLEQHYASTGQRKCARSTSHFDVDSCFVSRSACCSDDDTHARLIEPVRTCSRMKCQRMSMCFARECCPSFEERQIAARLSLQTLTAGVLPNTSNNHVLYQIASCIATPIAMYSASAVDSATTDCFFDNQLITFPFTLMTVPVMLCRSPLSLAQFASVNTSSSGASALLLVKIIA